MNSYAGKPLSGETGGGSGSSELYPGAPSYADAAAVRADLDLLSDTELEAIYAATDGPRTDTALTRYNADGELVASPLRISPQATEIRLVADAAYTALGILGTASGYGAIASGYGATASGLYSTASGYGSTASGTGAIASGYGATASGTGATASGYGAIASGYGATASGTGATASGYGATALGRGSNANRQSAFVAGSNSAPINTLWCGKGISNAAPTLWSIRGTGGQGTNIAGGDIAVDAGAGTGNALPGTGRLRATAAGSSGSTEQDTWIDQLTWDRGGVAIAAGSVPATASSPGRPGQIAWEAGYLYICVATDTWQRTALSTW